MAIANGPTGPPDAEAEAVAVAGARAGAAEGSLQAQGLGVRLAEIKWREKIARSVRSLGGAGLHNCQAKRNR